MVKYQSAIYTAVLSHACTLIRQWPFTIIDQTRKVKYVLMHTRKHQPTPTPYVDCLCMYVWYDTFELY
jgi:hypothetical protein